MTLSYRMDERDPNLGYIGWESGTMIGLGLKGVSVEMAVSSVGFSRSVMVLLWIIGGVESGPVQSVVSRRGSDAV
jgi:hypothetical protein